MDIETMISENEALIYTIADSIYIQNPHFDKEDLISVGYLALCQYGGSYDPERSKMSTFITHCVRNEMLRFVKRHKRHNHVEIQEYHDRGYEDAENTEIENYISFENDLEEKIVELRMKGLSRNIIGKTLGISTARVSRIMSVIKARLLHNG